MPLRRTALDAKIEPIHAEWRMVGTLFVSSETGLYIRRAYGIVYTRPVVRFPEESKKTAPVYPVSLLW